MLGLIGEGIVTEDILFEEDILKVVLVSDF